MHWKNYFLLIVMFVFVSSSVFAWIAGVGDATCNTIACYLGDDKGYYFTNLNFSGTTGFDDLVDDGAIGSNLNISELNVSSTIFFNLYPNWDTDSTDDLSLATLDNESVIRTWNESWVTDNAGMFKIANVSQNLGLWQLTNFTSSITGWNANFTTLNVSGAIVFGTYPNWDTDSTDDFMIANVSQNLGLFQISNVTDNLGLFQIANVTDNLGLWQLANFTSSITGWNANFTTLNVSGAIVFGAYPNWDSDSTDDYDDTDLATNMTTIYTNLDTDKTDDWVLANFTAAVVGSNANYTNVNVSGTLRLVGCLAWENGFQICPK